MFCIVWPEICPFQILLLKSTGSRDLGAHVLLSHGSCRHHEQQGQGSAVQLVPQSQGSRAVKMPGPAALGASWGCCCALLAAARDRHCPGWAPWALGCPLPLLPCAWHPLCLPREVAQPGDSSRTRGFALCRSCLCQQCAHSSFTGSCSSSPAGQLAQGLRIWSRA